MGILYSVNLKTNVKFKGNYYKADQVLEVEEEHYKDLLNRGCVAHAVKKTTIIDGETDLLSLPVEEEKPKKRGPKPKTVEVGE